MRNFFALGTNTGKFRNADGTISSQRNNIAKTDKSLISQTFFI